MSPRKAAQCAALRPCEPEAGWVRGRANSQRVELPGEGVAGHIDHLSIVGAQGLMTGPMLGAQRMDSSDAGCADMRLCTCVGLLLGSGADFGFLV